MLIIEFMVQSCQLCSAEFEVSSEDQALYDKCAPVFAGKKYSIPDPVYCPECRLQRRMLFRNENVMYRSKSSKSGRSLVSIYSPDKTDIVYSYDEWWGDDWDGTDYGRNFDFDRPFFEQFQGLFMAVPKLHLIQDGTSENCEYTNFGADNKNCYLAVCYKCEDVYYSAIFFSRDCCDCLQLDNGEKLYECIDSDNCYNSAYLQNSESCSDSYFLENCVSCKNCLGCKNLRNKEYYIFNKPHSKEEYERLFAEYELDSYSGLQRFKELLTS